MPARKTNESPVYQLKVTLKGSKPPIWRRIQVRGSTTLPKLHAILHAEFVEAIRDPGHPEHEEMLTWVGGSFDPLEFDVEAVNQELKYL